MAKTPTNATPDQQPPTATSLTPAPRRRWLWWFIGLIIILLAVAGLWWFIKNKSKNTSPPALTGSIKTPTTNIPANHRALIEARAKEYEAISSYKLDGDYITGSSIPGVNDLYIYWWSMSDKELCDRITIEMIVCSSSNMGFVSENTLYTLNDLKNLSAEQLATFTQSGVVEYLAMLKKNKVGGIGFETYVQALTLNKNTSTKTLTNIYQISIRDNLYGGACGFDNSLIVHPNFSREILMDITTNTLCGEWAREEAAARLSL